MRGSRRLLMTLPIVLGTAASGGPQPAAQITVLDPANLQQNLLSAARALEQINNQVRGLQNQVFMIARMDQNLVRLGGTVSPDLQKALGDINALLRAGDGIALRLAATQSGYQQLFPTQASAALTHDEAVRNAKARWSEQYGAFQRAALLQGQIADGIEADTSLLATAMGRSRDAVGALEALQAGNEITGLNVKQMLGLQGLLAAQYRAQTTKEARDLATEDEARQRFKTFLGTGTPYAASRY